MIPQVSLTLQHTKTTHRPSLPKRSSGTDVITIQCDLGYRFLFMVVDCGHDFILTHKALRLHYQ